MNAKTLLVASLLTISLVACAKKDDAAGTKMDSTAATVDSSMSTTPTNTTTNTTPAPETTPLDTTNKAVDANATPNVSAKSTDTAVMQDKAKNDSLVTAGDAAKK